MHKLIVIYHAFQKNVRYDFAYSVQDDETGSAYSHQEERKGDVTTGEYRVTLPDGRIQIVSYTADENGYRANVSYEPIKKKYKPPVVAYPQYKPEPEYILVGEPGYGRQGYGRRRRPRLRRPNRPRSRVQVKPQPEEILVSEPEEVIIEEHEEILVHGEPEELIVIEPEEIVVVEEGYLPPVPSSVAYTTPRSLSLTPTPNHHKPTDTYLPPLTPTPYHPPKPSPTPNYLPPLTPAPYHPPKPSPTPHYLPPVEPYATPIAKSVPLKTTITPYGTVSTTKAPKPYFNPYFPPTAPRSTISPLYANHPLYHPTSYKPSLASLIYTPSPKVSTPYPVEVTTPIPFKVTTLHSIEPVITTIHTSKPQPTTRAPDPIAKTSHKPRLSTLPPAPSHHPAKSLKFPSHNPSPYSPTPPPYPLNQVQRRLTFLAIRCSASAASAASQSSSTIGAFTVSCGPKC